MLDGAARRTLGQLAGSSSARFTNATESTPDRTSCSWLVRAVSGASVTVTVRHQRAGTDSVQLDAGTLMTTDAWITLVVLVATFGVLAFDRLPAAAAMGAAVGVLLLANVVDQGEALSGLSSSAPITIAALYVLAGAATVTGALSPLIDRVLDGSPGRADAPAVGAERSRARLARLAVASGGLSAVLPNTPLVALAAPRVVTWCRRSGVSASPYLIPLSYAAVFGGVVTVIGTSTNLVVSDLLVAQGGDPLGVFEITGVGLPVAAVGIAVLVLTAPRLLRNRRNDGPDEAVAAQPYTIALRVDADGPLVGTTVDAAGLRHLRGVFLAGVERAGTVVPARPGTMLNAGDLCYFAGDVVDVVDLLEIRGLSSAEDSHLIGAGDRPDAGLFEAVVSERSELAGSTLRDTGFRARYDAAVLAIRRHDDDLPGKLGTVVLRPGDVLLVLATPEFERQWRGHGDFSVIASLDAAPPVRRDRARRGDHRHRRDDRRGRHEPARPDGGVAARRRRLDRRQGDQCHRGPPSGEPERGADDRDVDQSRYRSGRQRARRGDGDRARQPRRSVR